MKIAGGATNPLEMVCCDGIALLMMPTLLKSILGTTTAGAGVNVAYVVSSASIPLLRRLAFPKLNFGSMNVGFAMMIPFHR